MWSFENFENFEILKNRKFWKCEIYEILKFFFENFEISKILKFSRFLEF
jgi:hypothetical protein